MTIFSIVLSIIMSLLWLSLFNERIYITILQNENKCLALASLNIFWLLEVIFQMY